MKLRNYKNSDREYNIGIDAGTGSVGWAVVDDETGDLCYFKNQPTWGSRVYNNANPASEARLNRGQRRRYDRKRQRICLLQNLFKEEIEKLDPNFFYRLNNSFRVKQERNFDNPLFNGSDFTEKEYYQDFPTIYHLRKFLMETEERADIRLIYLAFHNIVKTRGNFLYQDDKSLSAKNANMGEAVEELKDCLFDYLTNVYGEGEVSEPAFNTEAIIEIFENASIRKAEKKEKLIEAFGFPKELKEWGKQFANACLDYKAEFSKIFDVEAETTKFEMSSDEEVDKFKSVLDDGLALFEALEKVEASYKLMGILGASKGETLSACKIREYENYGKDLENLKHIFKAYFNDEHDAYFRGDLYSDGSGYNKQKAKGYTEYNLKRDSKTRKDFLKDIKKKLSALKESECLSFDDLEIVEKMLSRIEEDTFLKRLKTGDSGVIPYQLHLEEMVAIIENQSQYYKFLEDDQDKLTSLVTFRIPYYVGPLTQKNAAKDKEGKNRFAWSERLPGKENEKIYPWNWEDVIDKDASASNFMNRMIGTCTYLYGEQVLPRCSLLYEEFCVLNELNVAKFRGIDGEEHRFESLDRNRIVEELFKQKKTVNAKDIVNLLNLPDSTVITGMQGEGKFVSKLSTYNDFCKILGKDYFEPSDIEMIENLVLWCSLFEDKDILKRKIKQEYGEVITPDQIKQIIKKPYTGWGRLSKKLLTGLKFEANDRKYSIMDILREGNPVTVGGGDRLNKPMNLREILGDDNFGFQKKIDEINKDLMSEGNMSVDDMEGSPALKRTVNQAKKIVDEIQKIAGKPPKSIFIEYTRDIDPKTRNKRTTTRQKNIDSALKELKKELQDAEVKSNFKNASANDFNNERVVLYFMQNGKSMYSDKVLDFNNLSQYHVDHIIPQCYTKDDSFDNKVLVLQSENERKLDSLLISTDIQIRNKTRWKALLDAGLISQKKYNNLTRTNISENQLKGFVSRQLVETNQIVKFMKEMFEDNYPSTEVHYVKASVSSSLRAEDALDLPKCREINDFHHAHDAYLACRVGMFVKMRHPKFYSNPLAMTRVMKDFVKSCKSEYVMKRQTPGSGGFIVSSFMRSGFDKETGEIFKDTWDAEKEAARIRRVLNYKQCFITRMPEEISSNGGAFWDALIISPKDKKLNYDKLRAIKKDRDPNYYGYYNNINSWCSLIYSALDKKERKIFRILDLKLVDKYNIVECGNLETFCVEDAIKSKLEFLKIEVFPIYKNQLLEFKGCRYRFVSSGEVKPTVQIAFDLNQTKQIKSILSYSDDVLGINEIDFPDSDFKNLIEYTESKLTLFSKELSRKLRLDDMITGVLSPDVTKIKDFSKADTEIKRRSLINRSKSNLIRGILNCIKDGKRFDFSVAGGSSDCGRTTLSLNKYLGEIEFIDQSVTGMFEHKYKLC